MKKIYLSKYISKYKYYTLIFMFCVLKFDIHSQVTLLSSSGDGGFENGTSYSANGWTPVVSGTRTWQIGTAPTGYSGTRAAYVGSSSNNNGINSSTVQHFYRDIAIPSGVIATLNYKFKQSTIDDGGDYFNIQTTTTSYTPVVGTFPFTGYINQFENTSTLYTSFTAMPSIDLSSYAGSTVRLVITFDSDGTSPHANPAIDDISVTYCFSSIAYNVTGGGTICQGSSTTLPINLSGSQVGLNYQLKSNGVNVGSPIAGTGSAISFPAQSSIGTYTVYASGGSFCPKTMTGTATIQTTTIPSSNILTQGILNSRCSGTIDSLMAIGGLILDNTNLYSGVLNLAIPDNSATGVSSVTSVSGISTTAKIDSVIVIFNLNHAFMTDAEILLRAPNNKIIALAADQGPFSSGSYSNCRITSDASAPALSTTSAPITGTYKANATTATNLIGSFGTNLTSTFADLFTVINGNWKLEVYDDASLDIGTLVDWTLKICYRDTQTIWSPMTGLFTNSLATVPYTGTNLRKVFTKPTLTTKYYTTATNGLCNRVDSIVDSIKMASNLVALATSTTTGASAQCQDGNWTYYADPMSPDKWIFGINKSSGTLTGETVDISVVPTLVKTSTNGTNLEHGSFLMGRYWNVNGTITSGSVGVRFFYDPLELAAANNARDASFSLLPSGSLAVKNIGTEWFKTVSTPMNASFVSNIIGNKFPNTILKLTGSTGVLNGITYVEFSGITSFSGGTGGYSYGPPNSIAANALPVTWGDIIVQFSNAGYRLDWNTHSEKNASHFVVESAEDGRNFKEVSSIIKAFGNSTTTQKYHFDYRDFSDKLYYRIKQVDFEGKFDYSKIVMAQRSSKDFFDLQVYPIPMNESSALNISIKTNETSPLKIQLFDMDGKLVYNEIKSNEPSNSIDMSALSKGIYQLAVSCGSYKEVRKIVK